MVAGGVGEGDTVTTAGGSVGAMVNRRDDGDCANVANACTTSWGNTMAASVPIAPVTMSAVKSTGAGCIPLGSQRTFIERPRFIVAATGSPLSTSWMSGSLPVNGSHVPSDSECQMMRTGVVGPPVTVSTTESS